MSRHPHKTVTTTVQQRNIPILLHAKKGERADGWASFIPTTGFRQVRIFHHRDFKKAMSELSSEKRAFLVRLVSLKQKLEENQGLEDLLDTSHALLPFEQLKDALELSLRQDRGGSATGAGPVSPTSDAICGLLGTSADPITTLSVLLSTQLASARLVLWWRGKPRGARMMSFDSEGRSVLHESKVGRDYLRAMRAEYQQQKKAKFVPSVFCPDTETALYVEFLFAIRGPGICPKCEKVFFKQRPDQAYCSIEHREAHRVARWRERDKRRRKREKRRRQPLSLDRSMPKGV
jgi:hypothetical protein